jgi:hypothetical protein
MKNIFKLILYGLFFALPFESLGQDTHSVPSDFPTRPGQYNPSISNLTKFPSSPILRSKIAFLQAYPLDYGNCVDSIYYPKSSVISMEGETRYLITVNSIGYGMATGQTGANDSIVTIAGRKITYRSDSNFTRIVWKNRANRNVVDQLGFTFNSNVSVGDKFEVDITYDKIATADILGGMVMSLNNITNTTLVTFSPDSFTAATDTTFGSPVFFEKHKVSALFKLTVTDSAKFGVALQVKAGGSGWAGNVGGDLIVQNPGITDLTGGRWIYIPMDTLLSGDSIRVALYGIAGTGVTYIDSLMLLQSDK